MPSIDRLIFIKGDEPVLIERALAERLDSLGPDQDEFDRETIDAAAKTPGEWIAAASTVPFLSARRIVVVRQLLRAKSPDAEVLSGLPETALLILVADPIESDQDSQGAVRGWESAVKSAGGNVVSCVISKKDLVKAVRDEATRQGKTLSVPAAQLLCEMVGSSLSRATEEIEKLVLYVGEVPEIREVDVRKLTTPAREWNVFSLVDAITSGDAAGALKQLRILIASPIKAEEAASRNIIPQMLRQVRLLWQAVSCIEARVGPSNAPNSLTDGWPKQHSLASASEWVQGKTMQSARRVTYRKLAYVLDQLSLADSRMKGTAPCSSAMEAMELFVLDCCHFMRAT